MLGLGAEEEPVAKKRRRNYAGREPVSVGWLVPIIRGRGSTASDAGWPDRLFGGLREKSVSWGKVYRRKGLQCEIIAP